MYFVIQENEDPSLQAEGEKQPVEEPEVQRRELTVGDEQEIWRDITLTQYKPKHKHSTEIRAFTPLNHGHQNMLII